MIAVDFANQHEPGDECEGLHCWSHHIDEPDAPAYIACPECGHVYRTKGELRRQYLTATWSMVRAAFRPRRDSLGHLVPAEHGPAVGLRELLWFLSRALPKRAGAITFCQHCIHDF